MTRATQSPTREIIEDFAKEICRQKEKGSAPKKSVIFFRNDRKTNKERDIYLVPLHLLRYRKENGRISTNILSYEKRYGYLVEEDPVAQSRIEKFLLEKDPEKTEELKNSIVHSGQREPAIITCDGFLINGNRRRLALSILAKEDKSYNYMKVVILPGFICPSDNQENQFEYPPTISEIEEIEDRYQFQSEGKAEYTNFDKALAVQSKINLRGLKLEDILRDDPSYSNLSPKDFEKRVNKFREEFLEPLKCIDEYLQQVGRDGEYEIITSRWQAFYDYYKTVHKKLEDTEKLGQYGLRKPERSIVQDVAFKIIRQRDLPNMKLHMVMRKMLELVSNKESKEELFKLKDIEMSLEKYGKDGDDVDSKEREWIKQNMTDIIRQVKKASRIKEYEEDSDRPIDLLDDCLKRLNNEKLNPLLVTDNNEKKKALEILSEIISRAQTLHSTFDSLRQNKIKVKRK